MRLLTWALAVAVLTGSVFAQEVDIRSSYKPGMKLTRTSTHTTTSHASISVAGRKSQLDTTLENEFQRCIEILETDELGPTKIRTLVHKDAKRRKTGESVTQSDEWSVGHLIVLDGRGPSTKQMCDDLDVDYEALAKYKLRHEIEAVIAPGKSVKIGDSWQGNPERLRSWLDDEEAGVREASVTCRLVAIEDREGERVARIDLEISATGVAPKEQGFDTSEVVLTSRGEALYSFQSGLCVHLTFEWIGRVIGEFSAPDGRKCRFEMDLKNREVRTTQVGEADMTPRRTPAGTALLRPGIRRGDTFTRQMSQSFKGGAVVHAAGKESRIPLESEGEFTIAEEVLSASDGKVTEVRRLYRKAENRRPADGKRERGELVGHPFSVKERMMFRYPKSQDLAISDSAFASEQPQDPWDGLISRYEPVVPGDKWSASDSAAARIASAFTPQSAFDEVALDFTMMEIVNSRAEESARLTASFKGTRKTKKDEAGWSHDETTTATGEILFGLHSRTVRSVEIRSKWKGKLSRKLEDGTEEVRDLDVDGRFSLEVTPGKADFSKVPVEEPK